ncbi:LRC46 protein, partial [Pomatostomus ruficeps]|nr:LRC46 protein [Pomatostomus ruficeps]
CPCRFPRLLPASTVRLDRRNISSIGKLRLLAEIHSLYLQQNKIEKIENLDSFPNLRFLCLAGNRIPRVENLRCLPHLSALDLSHNRIRELDTEELPRSLQILDLTGNECARQDGYRDLVVAALPQLLELDSQPVHGNAAEEKTGRGFSSSEEDEDEDEDLLPELGFPFTAEQDFFVDLQRELAGRSRRRRKETLQEHQERLAELWERRELL